MNNAQGKHYGKSLLFIAATFLVLCVWLLREYSLPKLWELILGVRPGWILAAVGLMVLYWLLEAGGLHLAVRRFAPDQQPGTTFCATMIGQFFNCITPFSSGGQPMQVLWLRRRGVPASLGTACVSAKFLGFQTAFLILGGVLGLTNWAAVSEQIYGLRWLVVAGYAVNGGMIVLVMLTLQRAGIVRWLGGWLVRLGAKLHLVKRPRQALERFEASFADYRTALLSLLKTP